MKNNIVVFDIDIPSLMGNKVFDRVAANTVSHTLLSACHLHDEALKKGFRLVTADVFLNMSEKPAYVPMISNLTTPLTERLIVAGADPLILVCNESPFIATRFYAGLRRISAHFAHSYVFKGMRKRLNSATIYHQMFFPNTFDIASFAPVPFCEKKFVAMVSSNKRIDNWKKNLVLRLLYGSDVREIYDERRMIIKYFAAKGFDLYGFGWDKANDSAVAVAYRGTVDDKKETLSQYKFAFCLENSIFQGYVTEKIFDSMFAGCVPIYYGAPDVHDHIPRNAFIDLRDFKTYDDLHAFLRDMSEEVYLTYIANIKAFLHSREYHRFTEEHYANEIIAILEQSFNQHA